MDMPTKILIAVLAVAFGTASPGTPDAEASAAAGSGTHIVSTKTWTLKSHTVATYRMPINGLRVASNVLDGCYGFVIDGGASHYVAAGLAPFGTVFPEDPSKPDGGVPGAEKQADGKFRIPESAVWVSSWMERFGRRCEAAGWKDDSFTDTVKTKHSEGVDARAARSRGAHRRRAFRASQPIQVLFAGSDVAVDGTPTLVVRIATNRLRTRTTLATHARVLEQE